MGGARPPAGRRPAQRQGSPSRAPQRQSHPVNPPAERLIDHDPLTRVQDFILEYRAWIISAIGTLAAITLGYAALAAEPAESDDGETASVDTVADLAATGPATNLADLTQATVQLIGLDEATNPVCTGSGVLVDPSGVIITNAHVVTRSDVCPFASIGVALTQEASRPPVMVHSAELLAVDEELDLAVVRIDGWTNPNRTDPLPAEFPTAPLGDSDTVALGDRIRILGYPAIGGDTITSTSGEVSGFTGQRGMGDRALIKTDATVSAGNSGGMALNEDGHVIGIPTKAKASETGPAVDCRPVSDTNGDGAVDEADACTSVGGFLNGIRPINLIRPLLETATVELAETRLPSVIADVKIANPRFSSGRKDDAPIDELVSGQAGMAKLCLFVDWEGIPNGTQWDGVWYLDGEPVPAFSTVGGRWVFGESGGNFWMCAMDPARGLDAGLYSVALFLNGELAFAEVIEVADSIRSEYPVTWVNNTNVELCAVAINPMTEHRQVGANELRAEERVAPGGQITLTLPEGLIVAEAYDCAGRPVADALDGLVVNEAVTFDISNTG